MGRPRDFVDPNRSVESLETYGIPTDPRERKQFEADQRQQLEARTREATQTLQQNPRPPEPVGTERVFLVNNKARPIHIPDEGHVIDGQLAVSARGPFLTISKEKFDSSYQLQTYLEKPLSATNPYLQGKTIIEKLTEEEYKARFRDYVKGKSAREAEYAKVGTNVGTHGDGTLDEFDAANEVRKINPKILRAQS